MSDAYHRYTKEQVDFLAERDGLIPWSQIAEEFNAEFGANKTADMLYAKMYTVRNRDRVKKERITRTVYYRPPINIIEAEVLKAMIFGGGR